MGAPDQARGREITSPGLHDISVNDILAGSELNDAFPDVSPDGRFLVTEVDQRDLAPNESIDLHLSVTAIPITSGGEILEAAGQVNFLIPTQYGNAESEADLPVVKTVEKIGHMQ